MGFAPDSNEHLDYSFAEYLFRKFPQPDIPVPELRKYREFESKRSWESV
ncbi:MAG: hypothetical protein U5N56_07235 [Candidatus Marinimicrobia bacterium]|nr:hypothetical protein [Candidatus Neomarinimicrobiota bacterium]